MNSWAEHFDMRAMAEELTELRNEVKELRDKVDDLERRQEAQAFISAPMTGGFTPRNRSITV